jgi:hypothetical protein
MKKPGESKRIGVAGFMFGSRSRGVNRIFERLGLFVGQVGQFFLNLGVVAGP